MLKNIVSMSALSVYRSAVQFLLNLFIASFVLPGEYGLIVFTTPFIIFISLMTDMGLSSAIVRDRSLTDLQINSAFFLTIMVGTCFAGIMIMGAYPLEWLTKMPGLSGVMAGMSISLVLMIGCSVPRALLERQLNYSAVASTEAISVFASAICAVILVMIGSGIWALIAYNIMANAMRFSMFLWRARRVINKNVDFRGLAPLLSFGVWVFATNTLTFLARNGDNVLIGAYLGAVSVGLYGLAYQFMTLPLIAITWPASGVLLATLSREGLNSEQSKRLIYGLVGITASLSFPLMTAMTFALDYPIKSYFSSEWQGMLDILHWLAPVGALQSIAAYNGSVLLVAGKARLNFSFSLLNTVTLLATFALALPFGLHIFVIAYACTAVLMSVMLLCLMVVQAHLSFVTLAGQLGPALLAASAGYVVATTFATRLPFDGFWSWLCQVGAFGVVVLATYTLMHHRIMGMVSGIRN